MLRLRREVLEHRARFEELLREREKVKCREGGRPDLLVLVLIEPEGQLHLEEHSLKRLELLGGAIDDEAHREVVEHLFELRRFA